MDVGKWTHNVPSVVTRYIIAGTGLIVLLFAFIVSSFAGSTTKAHADSTPDWTQNGFTKVVTNNDGSCGITTTHHLWCWGGSIPGYTIQTPQDGPRQIDSTGVLAGKSITDFAMSDTHYCATADGALYCWGQNTYGQLGNGTLSNSSIPVAVDTTGGLSGKTITAISAGQDVTCAVASGAAYCWGSGQNGRLGRNEYYDASHSSTVPIAVDTSGALSGKTVSSISVGSNVTCAAAGNAAYCWGINATMQLGSNVTATISGGTAGSLTPVAVDASGVLSGKSVSEVSVGTENTCVVAGSPDSRAYCWGTNAHGELGDGTTNGSYTAVQAGTTSAMAGSIINDISVSSSTACANANGIAYCWGNGPLGDANSPASSIVPVAVDTSGTLSNVQVSTISASANHVCATTAAGGLGTFCWGDNTTGAIGNFHFRQASNVASPEPVIDDPPIVGSVNSVVEADGQPQDAILQGRNFRADMQITVDGIPGSIKSIDNPAGTDLQTMVIRVPGSTVEHAGLLAITNAQGDSDNGGILLNYQLLAPSVDTMSPRSGLVGTSRSVTITGNQFYPSTVVTVDGVAAMVTSVSKSQLTVLFPSNTTPGPKDVELTNAGGLTGASYQYYYVNHLTVTSIFPNTVYTNGLDAQLTLSGDGFSTDTTITVDGVPATNIGFADMTSMIFSVPGSMTPKSSTIVVDNGDGEVITLPNAIQYTSPYVTSVDYSTDQGGNLLNVHGQGFEAGYSGLGLQESLVSLNGNPIPFCTTSTYSTSTLTSYGYDPQYFSDTAPCYIYLDDNGGYNGVYATTPSLFQIRLPDGFNENAPLSVQLLGSPVFHYIQGSEPSHFIVIGGSTVVKNDMNSNLSSQGTTDPRSSVTLYSSSNIPISTIPVDTTQDRDWSAVLAGTDVIAHKAFTHGITTAPGSLSGTFSLLIPKAQNDNAVVICPGAASLSAVSLTCPSSHTYGLTDSGVTIVSIGGASYWEVSGLTGTGGVSTFIPNGVAQSAAPTTQSGKSLVNSGLTLRIIGSLAAAIIFIAIFITLYGRKKRLYSLVSY